MLQSREKPREARCTHMNRVHLLQHGPHYRNIEQRLPLITITPLLAKRQLHIRRFPTNFFFQAIVALPQPQPLPLQVRHRPIPPRGLVHSLSLPHSLGAVTNLMKINLLWKELTGPQQLRQHFNYSALSFRFGLSLALGTGRFSKNVATLSFSL